MQWPVLRRRKCFVDPSGCFIVYKFMGIVLEVAARSVLIFIVIGLRLPHVWNDKPGWVNTFKRLSWFLTFSAF